MLNFIDHLPAASHFGEAYANDEEVAALVADAPDAPAWKPRLSDWTPELDELTRISDGIGQLSALYLQSHGQSVRIPTRPRPVTAFDRARAATDEARHRSLVKRLIVAAE